VTLDLTGVLQGVGFRPTMARLVSEWGLAGWVRNQAGVVRLVLVGEEAVIDRFVEALPMGLPRQARLDSVLEIGREPVATDQVSPGFRILESEGSDRLRVSIPADLVSCAACVREVFSGDSRYRGYAFTTCTDCGPRYTVVDGMPYDRERTTLGRFPLCEACRADLDHAE
jgi:hydrogenase maturation protein HypF